MTMGKYIAAVKAAETISEKTGIPLSDLVDIFAEIPAADVAPVVRCKDCKYRDGTPGQPNILCAQMHEDDFCSYGECREDKDG